MNRPSVIDLVQALGGPTETARQCGVTVSAVGWWQVSGSIPPRHWLRLWRLAKERGIDWRPPGAGDLDLVLPSPDTITDQSVTTRSRSSAAEGQPA